MEQRLKLAALAAIGKALHRAATARCRGLLLEWRRGLRAFELDRDTVWRTQGPWNTAGVMARRVKAVRILRRVVRRQLRGKLRGVVTDWRVATKEAAMDDMRRQVVLSTQSSMSMAIQAVHRIEGARLVFRLLRRLKLIYPLRHALVAMRVNVAVATDWYSNRLSARLEDRISEVESEFRP